MWWTIWSGYGVFRKGSEGKGTMTEVGSVHLGVFLRRMEY